MIRSFAMAALVASLMAVAAAVPAFADLPQNLLYVDHDAPDFRWPATDLDGDGVLDRLDHCPNTPKGAVVDKWGCSIDSDGDGVADGIDQCPDTPKGEKVGPLGCSDAQKAAMAGAEPQAIKEQPKAGPVQPSSPAAEMERQLLATGSIRLENIYFETASARLLPESEETLREAGHTLEKFPDLKVEIEGHTDTRGWAQYNMRLSQARAEAVRTHLLQNFHLKTENYVAKGYGETRPETAERNQEELLRNRRVVLRVLNPEVLPKGVDVEHKP